MPLNCFSYSTHSFSSAAPPWIGNVEPSGAASLNYNLEFGATHPTILYICFIPQGETAGQIVQAVFLPGCDSSPFCTPPSVTPPQIWSNIYIDGAHNASGGPWKWCLDTNVPLGTYYLLLAVRGFHATDEYGGAYSYAIVAELSGWGTSGGVFIPVGTPPDTSPPDTPEPPSIVDPDPGGNCRSILLSWPAVTDN
jgi:hypothetical protein